MGHAIEEEHGSSCTDLSCAQTHTPTDEPRGGGGLWFSEQHARQILRALIGDQSIGGWSRANGLAPQQVESFLRGKRPLEPKLARAMVLRRASFYQRASDTSDVRDATFLPPPASTAGQSLADPVATAEAISRLRFLLADVEEGAPAICDAPIFASMEFARDMRLVVSAAQRVSALDEAVQALVEEKADYMRLNSLGDPEAQHTVKLGRRALSSEGPSISRRCEATCAGNPEMDEQ